MIRLYDQGAYVFDGHRVVPAKEAEATGTCPSQKDAAKETLTYQILTAHTAKDADAEADRLRLRFDCLASHDITYVGIVQTLRAASPDMTRFPVPYVLSNCHNSLCAVGGTINGDDHAFGLSAAKKYGGIYVPPHMAVIHQYMRERMTGCGKMILGSDSHTRYGALGTMGIGEGGGELVKQLLKRTYDIPFPGVVGVCLTGEPAPGVGPQDVALALIGAVFENGYVKNKVMEFFGDGVAGLSMDFRNGIDVMTTETACLSSIWVTDAKVEEYYAAHGRAEDYKPLAPGKVAYYDGLIELDLSTIKPMIALPFHPSHVFEIDNFIKNISDILAASGEDFAYTLDGGRLRFGQGVIAGCAGGLYENICAAAGILDGHSTGNGDFTLSVYPASQPVYVSLSENGTAAKLMRAGAVLKTAFCGPCFGAGDVPANNALSARHATRNFPNREGSKPDAGQNAAVALMDARSIASTAKNGGLLTAATEADMVKSVPQYFFDRSLYEKRVYDGWGMPDANAALKLGPGIRDWPALSPLAEDLLLNVAAFITDAVTTTDELIPSGETSSYRSNPYALAEFTLSRKCPDYVADAKNAALPEQRRKNGEDPLAGDPALAARFEVIGQKFPADARQIGFGSLVYAVKPGDGSAREQAASCQRVLGGIANIAREYATKRYRSNLVNWGMLPFVLTDAPDFQAGDFIFIPGVRKAVEDRQTQITAYVVRETLVPFTLTLPDMTENEAQIILHGGLINYYRAFTTSPSENE